MDASTDIRTAVYGALVDDPLIDTDDIEVQVLNGDVLLNGTVPSQAQSSEATAAARRVVGVTAVHNLLGVALPSDDYGDDAALAQLASDALAANAGVPDGIEASAREGNLSLTGTVSSSAQRAAAEDAVAGCAGGSQHYQRDCGREQPVSGQWVTLETIPPSLRHVLEHMRTFWGRSRPISNVLMPELLVSPWRCVPVCRWQGRT